MSYTRAITSITSQKSQTHLAPKQRFNLRKRINIADRLLGTHGMRPNTRFTEIITHPILTGRNITETIREILTFSRENHEATFEVIGEGMQEVEALSRDEVLAQAQTIVNAYYKSKITESNDSEMKAAFPTVPTIEEFAALEPNAHFDPYQMIASGTFGIVSMRIDFGRMLSFEKAMEAFDLRRNVREAMVMARAFEIL